MIVALFGTVIAYKGSISSLEVSKSTKGTNERHYSLKDATFPPLKADDTHTLIFDISITDEKNNPKQPQGVLLLLTASDETVLPNGVPRTQSAPFVVENDNQRLSFSLGGTKKILSAINGDYDMEIVAGDIVMENTIRKSLGRLSVRFSELEDTIDIRAGKRRIYALRSEESETALTPIDHLFDVPQARPWFVITLAVLILVCPVAYVILILGYTKMGANAGFFPKGIHTPIAIGFQSCLLSAVSLLFAFWLFLNIIQTSFYLVPVCIATVFVGHRAMCENKDARSNFDPSGTKKTN